MQKLLHREIQSVLMLIFKRPTIVIAIFSLLLLPGVFVHELSHLMVALILRVPINKFSIIPRTLKNGQLRLGYVETKQTDLLRDSLIGLAPFIAGLMMVAYIGFDHLGLENLKDSAAFFDINLLLSRLGNFGSQKDFGIWLYLAFCISSTMIPSASDRQSWKVLIFIFGIIIIIFLLFGTGDFLQNNLLLRLDGGLFSIAFIIFTSTLIHVLILIPTWFIKLIISNLTGRRIISNVR